MAFHIESVPLDTSIFVLKAGDTMTGSLLSSLTNTNDLGSAAQAWRSGYFGTSLLGATAAAGTFDVDTVNSPVSLRIGGTTAEEVKLGRAGKNVVVDGDTIRAKDIDPQADNTSDLGDDASNKRWRAAYAYTANLRTALSFSGATDPFEIDVVAGSAGQGIRLGAAQAGNLTLGRSGKKVIVAADDLEPSTNNSRDLGTSAIAWKTGYFAASLLFTGSADIDASGATELRIGGTNATPLKVGRSGVNVTLVGDALVAATNNTRDLGTSGVAFRSGYFAQSLLFNAAGIIDQTSALALSIAPTTASALNLGRAGITTLVNGTLRYDNDSNTAVDGTLGSQPTIYEGYLVVNVDGTDRKVPFFKAA